MILLLSAVLGLNSFVMAGFEVPTSSMEDTVKAGDRLFVNKFVSHPFASPTSAFRAFDRSGEESEDPFRELTPAIAAAI